MDHPIIKFKEYYERSEHHSRAEKLVYATCKTVKDVRETWGPGKIDLALATLILMLLPSCRSHVCNIETPDYAFAFCRQVVVLPLSGLIIYDAYHYVIEKLKQPISPAVQPAAADIQ